MDDAPVDYECKQSLPDWAWEIDTEKKYVSHEIVQTQGANLRTHPPSPCLLTAPSDGFDPDQLAKKLGMYTSITHRYRVSMYGQAAAEKYPHRHTPVHHKKRAYREARRSLREMRDISPVPVDQLPEMYQHMTDEERDHTFFIEDTQGSLEYILDLETTDGESSDDDKDDKDNGDHEGVISRARAQKQAAKNNKSAAMEVSRKPGQEDHQDISQSSVVSSLASPPPSSGNSPVRELSDDTIDTQSDRLQEQSAAQRKPRPPPTPELVLESIETESRAGINPGNKTDQKLARDSKKRRRDADSSEHEAQQLSAEEVAKGTALESTPQDNKSSRRLKKERVH